MSGGLEKGGEGREDAITVRCRAAERIVLMRQGICADTGASGFGCSAPCVDLRRYAAPFSLIAWGVRTRLKRVAGRLLRLPLSDSARPRSAMVGGLSRGGADKVLTYVFSRAIFHLGKIIER